MKQGFNYSNIAMENNVTSRFKCFTFCWIWFFNFVFFLFLLDSLLGDSTCGCIMSISIIENEMEIRYLLLMMFSPPTSMIFPSTSSSTTSSFRRITWMILLFIRNTHCSFRGLRCCIPLPIIFLLFHKLLHKRVKSNGLELHTSL